MSQLATESRTLSPDEVFATLKNPRRRSVIRYLQENGGQSTVRELTAEIAAIENDVPVSELAYGQRKTVYTSLYQTHLPKLDELDVIDYDQRSGDVVLADDLEELEVHLEAAERGSPPSDDGRRSRRATAALVGITHLNLAVVGGWVLAYGGLTSNVPAVIALVVAVLLAVGAWYNWFETAEE